MIHVSKEKKLIFRESVSEQMRMKQEKILINIFFLVKLGKPFRKQHKPQFTH